MAKKFLFQAPPVSNSAHKQALKAQLIDAHAARLQKRRRFWLLAPAAICLCLLILGWNLYKNSRPAMKYGKAGSIVWENSGQDLIIEGFQLENGAQILTIENRESYAPNLGQKQVRPVRMIY